MKILAAGEYDRNVKMTLDNNRSLKTGADE